MSTRASGGRDQLTLLFCLGRYVGSLHQFATVTQPNGSEH